MKHKKLCNLIFILLAILTTSVFAKGNKRVTDAEIGITLPMGPYGGVDGVNMVDTVITIENGDLWIWGYRDVGLSGNGIYTVLPNAKPQRVNFFVKNGINIIQAAGGAYHILALDENGDVWGWGRNTLWPAVGKYRSEMVVSPVRVLQGKDVIQINAGEYISIALTKAGEVYTWGHNHYAQAGRNLDRDKYPVVSVDKIPQAYFNNQPVVLIGGAYEGGYAVNALGEAFGWGDEQDNSFGYNNAKSYRIAPIRLNIKIEDGRKINYICGGEGFTEYLLDDGNVYGMGGMYRLGQNQTYGKTMSGPIKIMDKVKTLYCRFDGSLAITFDNDIYTWGVPKAIFNIYGLSPIKRDHAREITKVDGGKEHIIYWTDQGKAYGMGYGAAYKFSLTDGSNVNIWPGKSLDFLIDEMKEIYGKDYIIGQGK